jgi:hypothetical protein
MLLIENSLDNKSKLKEKNSPLLNSKNGKSLGRNNSKPTRDLSETTEEELESIEELSDWLRLKRRMEEA